MTHLLITGLCLQGNKGGPALAQSHMGQLRRQLGEVEFTLSVPAGTAFAHEQRWSQIYGVEVVESFSIKDILPPFCLFPFPTRIKRFLHWWRTLRRADAIVEMSAISYVGPPSLPERTSLLGGRFHYFLAAWFARRPFLAWTQSLGPFTGKWAPRLARLDLARQPIVFCRGENSLQNVRALLPNKEARAYPDVATGLPFDHASGRDLVERLEGLDQEGRLVSISPSAVLYRKLQRGERNLHVEQMAELCKWLAARGYRVLLLPHTYHPDKHAPETCDYGVCLAIMAAVGQTRQIVVLHEDLSPVELKSIISISALHIGGRYHSVVAALSSGVPCISLAWHPKYRDIMAMYGMEEFVCDATDESAAADIQARFLRLTQEQDACRERLSRRQAAMLAQVEENARLFTKCLREMMQ